MSAKSGNSRNKIDAKRLCLYSVLTALCLGLGFLERLIPTDIVAPGIKLGLANGVALLLVCQGDILGAFLVNLARIFISALLFGSAVSLGFSLCAGVVSLALVAFFYRLGIFGAVGLSVLGGVVHNITQTAVAWCLLGSGVLLNLPLLLVGGTLSGALVGMLCGIILKKIETKQ